MLNIVKCYLILVACLVLSINSSAQKNTSNSGNKTTGNDQKEDFEIDPETAHPKAKKMLKEEFFWSPIEESGPFGNDDGWEAFFLFRDWRKNNAGIKPLVYLNQLIKMSGYPYFQLNEMNEDTLMKYVSSFKTGSRFLTGQDNLIIAIGFAQFVLEGKIDEEMKAFAKLAIKRELLPRIFAVWEGDKKNKRRKQLTKMLEALDKMNE